MDRPAPRLLDPRDNAALLGTVAPQLRQAREALSQLGDRRQQLLIGWLVGMVSGTYMAYLQSSPKTAHFASSAYPLRLGSPAIIGYAGLYAVILTVVVVVVLSAVFALVGVARGMDQTAASDYVDNLVAVPVEA